MHRTWAIVERELRRFRRSPILIVISMVFPLVQLVVLGYAFGGNVKHLKVAVVDQDGGVPAVRVRELAMAVAGGARTFETVQYADQGAAVEDLRNGQSQRRADHSAGILPPRAQQERSAHRADRRQHRQLRVGDARRRRREPADVVQPADVDGPRFPPVPQLDVVEVYPYVPYVQYLLPGIIVMSIFMMVMIGGGIIFIDDKARGLHEGYLVTPITQARAGGRLQPLGDHQGRAGGLFDHDRRQPHRRHPDAVRSAPAAAPVRRRLLHGVRADQHDVPHHGARDRSADAARDLRRAEHAAVLPERRDLSAAGISRPGCR